jgi:hypothetical protein
MNLEAKTQWASESWTLATGGPRIQRETTNSLVIWRFRMDNVVGAIIVNHSITACCWNREWFRSRQSQLQPLKTLYKSEPQLPYFIAIV